MSLIRSSIRPFIRVCCTAGAIAGFVLSAGWRQPDSRSSPRRRRRWRESVAQVPLMLTITMHLGE